MARTTKRTPRTPRQARAAAPAVEPRDTRRGAGAPAPASAAATAPLEGARGGAESSGFYNPDSEGPRAHQSEAVAQLGAGEINDGRHAETQRFAETTQRQAVRHEETTVDVSLARQALSEEPEAGYQPGEDLETDIARIRGMRRPLGAYSQKLALPKRPGYHTHWFNDEGGRIDDALSNGWAFRRDADGKNIRRAVGRGRDAGVLYAYAMDLPEVFWLEDMAARHQQAKDKMESLKGSPARGRPGEAKREDSGKFYNPVESEGREFIEVRTPQG